MPNPLPTRAVRTLCRTPLRRGAQLLVLTALALPLVVLAPAPAGVVGVTRASAEQPPGTPQQILVVDGLGVHLGVTSAPDVAGALADLAVDRGPLDRVEPGLDEPLEGPTVIRLARAELIEEQVEVRVPREVVRRDDPSLLRGLVRVERAGRDGRRIDTQLVLVVDGEEESRLTVGTEVVREPRARIERVGTRTLADETVWDALARCESGGRWDAVRMIGGRIAYAGGLQFAPRTWDAFRPEGFPALASDATRLQQIEVAERVRARQGWGAWPACARRLGLR